MATTKLNRRQFLQALAAGLAVASMPAAIPLAERVETATKAMKVPGWGFIVRGGSGGFGDSLILLPPGTAFNIYNLGHTYVYPQPLPNRPDLNGQIVLMPWRKYQKQIEGMFPEVVAGRYNRLLKAAA